MEKITDDQFLLWAKWRSIPCWLRHLHSLGYPQETLDDLEYIDDQFYLFSTSEKRLWQESSRKNLPRDESGWFEIFPEAKSFIPIKIAVWIAVEKKLFEIVANKIRQFNTTPHSQLEAFIFKEWLALNEAANVATARKNIKRLRYLISPKRFSSQRITQSDIDAARTVPIESLLLNSNFIKSGANLKTLCPLHDERTPSFYVYADTNTFHCFGCGRGRSSIDLVMLLNNCGFIDAVKQLAIHS